VDPFHLSRVRDAELPAPRRQTSSVYESRGAKLVWIGPFSHEAVRLGTSQSTFNSSTEITEKGAVEQDWNDWHRYVIENGTVVFHDARIFPGGWTSAGYGPVRFVDRVFSNNPSSSWVIFEEVDSLVFVRRRERGSA